MTSKTTKAFSPEARRCAAWMVLGRHGERSRQLEMSAIPADHEDSGWYVIGRRYHGTRPNREWRDEQRRLRR